MPFVKEGGWGEGFWKGGARWIMELGWRWTRGISLIRGVFLVGLLVGVFNLRLGDGQFGVDKVVFLAGLFAGWSPLGDSDVAANGAAFLPASADAILGGRQRPGLLVVDNLLDGVLGDTNQAGWIGFVKALKNIWILHCFSADQRILSWKATVHLIQIRWSLSERVVLYIDILKVSYHLWGNIRGRCFHRPFSLFSYPSRGKVPRIAKKLVDRVWPGPWLNWINVQLTSISHSDSSSKSLGAHFTSSSAFWVPLVRALPAVTARRAALVDFLFCVFFAFEGILTRRFRF